MSLAHNAPRLIADLLRQAGHPDLRTITAMDTPTVRADLADGSTNYVKVAHVQTAGERAPGRPSWPGHLVQPNGASR